MVDKQQKLPKNNKLIRSHSGEIKRSLVTKNMLKYELLQLRIQFDVYLVGACIVVIGAFGYEPAEEYLFHGGFVTLGKHSPQLLEITKLQTYFALLSAHYLIEQVQDQKHELDII